MGKTPCLELISLLFFSFQLAFFLQIRLRVSTRGGPFPITGVNGSVSGLPLSKPTASAESEGYQNDDSDWYHHTDCNLILGCEA